MMEVPSYWDIFRIASIHYGNNVAITTYFSATYKHFTYNQLFTKSSSLYDKISTKLRIGETIGILMKQNALIPAIISIIHRCKCAFIFLDFNQSEKHNQEMIDVLSITKIFSEKPNISENDNEYTIDDFSDLCCETDAMLFFFTRKIISETENKDHFSDIAYYIRTSGTTAIAKNVAVTHQCIYPNIRDFRELFSLQAKDIIYFSTPLTFDPSVIEIYSAALCGASLMLCPSDLNILFPLETNSHLSITVWQTTPSMFLRFGSHNIRKLVLCENSSLRILALGGEPIAACKHLADIKHKNNTTRVFNLYGITEVSCWASVAEVDFMVAGDISLGTSLSDTELRVCDSSGNSIMNGIGDIFIGSFRRKCLVDNEIFDYLNSAVNLKSQILQNSNLLWRNTGDVGEVLNGQVYFRGRNDRVIKRYGHKVNLLEVENVSVDYANIEQSTCLWLPEDQKLVLFYTSNQESVHRENLIEYFKNSLTPQSLPDVFYQIDKMPLTCHGKLSKIKLKDIYDDISKHNNCQNHVKLSFIDFLNEALKVKIPELELLANESFVNLGGDSLGAIQIINKLDNYTMKSNQNLYLHLLDIDFPLKNVFKILDETYSPLEDTLNEASVVHKISINDIDIDAISNSSVKDRCKKRSILSDNIDPKKVCLENNSKSISFTVMWKYNSGKCIDASPVLYTDSRGHTFVLVGSHSGNVLVMDGIVGSPAFVLHVASRVEAPILCFTNDELETFASFGCYDGTFWCFSLLDFRIMWTVPLNAMIKSQACHIQSRIFVATYEGVIWSICEKNGEVLSYINVGNQGITADLLVSSAGCVYSATLSGLCVCISINNNDLKIKWTTQLSSPIFAKPAFINQESKLLVCEVKSQVHCLDAATGNKLWAFSEAEGLLFSSCLVFAMNGVEVFTFGCHDCNSYRVLCEKDQEPVLLKKTKHSSEVYATPCAMDDGGTVWVAIDGELAALGQSGEVLGRHRLPGRVFSSPVVKDDLMFVGCRDDNLYCLKMKEIVKID